MVVASDYSAITAAALFRRRLTIFLFNFVRLDYAKPILNEIGRLAWSIEYYPASDIKLVMALAAGGELEKRFIDSYPVSAVFV
jgi:hypothetical protein